MNLRFRLLPIVTLIAVLAASAAADQVVTYKLQDVTFEGGSAATGTFQWDWTTNAAVDCNIVDGGGHFYLGGSYPTTLTTSSIDGAYDYQNISYNIALVFDKPITPTTGAAIVIDPQQSYFQIDLSGNGGGVTTYGATEGTIVPVPEPATWAALTLGGLMIFRRRRAETRC